LTFSDSTIPFSKQIVSVYSKTLGSWSFPVIAAIAMLTMFSTALTVIDAYPRTLEASLQQLFPKISQHHRRFYWLWAVGLSLSAIFIIGFLSSSMKRLLDFATIVSFLAAPVFAFLNYKVVTSKLIRENSRPGRWLRLLGIIGILFLSGFSLIYLYSRIFL
jgi:Mn2+/Fe2+ NRAMP family transporter